MIPKFASGKATGTGAAINVSLGFRPLYVRIINTTDGNKIDEFVASSTNSDDDMAAGTSVTTSNTATTEVATRATNGISQYAGTDSTALGFTIGSGISVAAKALHWIAIGH